MILKILALSLVLPAYLFANSTAPVEEPALPTVAETLLPMESDSTNKPAVPSDSIVTESEFSGNPAIDSLDAGNDENAVASAEEIAEQTSEQDSVSKFIDEVAATNQSADADSNVSEADDEKEMSQEEADAELAAAMGSSDSSATDSTRKLILDMTTAFIPTESRRIAGPYGIRTYRMHRGVDLGLCHGEDRTIVAAFAGKVKLVRNQGRRKGYGKYVIIDHGNGLTTLYAHLASWNVKIGDELQAGDTIGIGGNTGRSFGAHLHFEMKYNGVYIDPTTVFNFQEGTYLVATTEIDQTQIQSIEDEYQKELAKHRYYKVRRGDCLGKIARRYGISVGKLKRLNGLKSNKIRPGQVLRCS